MSEELTTKVQDLIDNMINPAVAGHGGFVQLVDVKDNKVYLQMGGGCQGCGAADVTLKQGIERLIKEDGLLVVGADYSLDSGIVSFFDGVDEAD